jgi:hypothetical protein
VQLLWRHGLNEKNKYKGGQKTANDGNINHRISRHRRMLLHGRHKTKGMSNDLLYIAGSLFLSGGLCAYHSKAGYAASGFVVGFFCALIWWGFACNYKKKVLQEESAKSTAPGIVSSGETSFDAVIRLDADTGKETLIRSTVGHIKTGVELEIKTGYEPETTT